MLAVLRILRNLFVAISIYCVSLHIESTDSMILYSTALLKALIQIFLQEQYRFQEHSLVRGLDPSLWKMCNA